MLLIGHRGASHEAPENTLPAFERAWEEGADGIEADLRLTMDSRIVCIHDPSTGRTAEIDISVATSLLDDLRRLDVGRWKGFAWAGTRIPVLSEVLTALPVGKELYLELKSGSEIIEPLELALANAQLDCEQIMILSFDAAVIADVKRRLPLYRACWLTDYQRLSAAGGWFPSVNKIIDTLQQTGVDGLGSRAGPFVDTELVSALRRAGLEIHVWTVDNMEEAERFKKLEVDSILTNRPGWLRKMTGT